MNLLSKFGYPLPGDNARVKAASLYDVGTITTGVTEYNLFINPALSVYNRNRVFPLSGSEIFLINSLRVLLKIAAVDHIALAALFTFLKESFLQIIVDEREKIKIPLLECITFPYSNVVGEGAFPIPLDVKYFKRRRMLQYPIIVNANSNVQAKIVTTSASATAYDGVSFQVYFDGIKYDKLTDYNVDFWQGKEFEKLSYSIYDVNTLAGTEETIECFSNRNKAVTLFNKTLPLGDKESFSIEAVELFTQGAGASINVVMNEINGFYLEIGVDDTQFYTGKTYDMFTVGHRLSTSFEDTNTDTATTILFGIEKNLYVLPEPIIIPANSKASVKLRHAAITAISGNVLVDFRGTLTRRVA